MWPFTSKNKGKVRPKTPFEYFLLGVAHGKKSRKKYGRPASPPSYRLSEQFNNQPNKI